MNKADHLEILKDVICDAGTEAATCGFCGKHHEAESSHASVSVGQLEGTVYVWGCGCQKSEERLSRVAEWLMDNRMTIARFYGKVSERMRAQADMISQSLV